MSSNFHEGHRTNIIAFEVSKASLTVHSLPDDQQVTIPNTAPAVRRLLSKTKGSNPFVIARHQVDMSDMF